MKSNILSLLLFISIVSCQNEPVNEAYLAEIEQWRNDRLASLTKPDGWTTLIGLHWLEQGDQSFGASEDNDIIFPAKAPGFIGNFNLSGDSISVQIKDSIDILIDGKNIKSAVVKSDQEDQTTYMNWESLTWYIIQRGDKFGVRIKDSLAEERFNLKEIPHYPVDENWKIKASFLPADSGAVIKIENILGQISDNPLEGLLEFTYKNKNYRLAATNGGKNHYFVIIADETTGEETYGGGRYLDVVRADSTGQTFIDFNKAYNPPCVFSVFATCPLPPEDNYLPFPVLAGEKELEGH